MKRTTSKKTNKQTNKLEDTIHETCDFFNIKSHCSSCSQMLSWYIPQGCPRGDRHNFVTLGGKCKR